VQGLQSAKTRRSAARRSRRANGAARHTPAPVEPPQRALPLQSSVLVLNRLYMVVHVVNARRAFAMLFRDLAEVVHLEQGVFANYTFRSWREMSELRAGKKAPDEDWIRAVNFEIQIPRVIRLLGFDRVPDQRFHLNRHSVLARDNHCCQYCGDRFPSQLLSLDHVVPRSLGGPTTWENVVCACMKCNTRKGGRTPKEAKMTLVRRPFKPKRNPILLLKLDNPKYASWRTWLDGGHGGTDGV